MIFFQNTRLRRSNVLMITVNIVPLDKFSAWMYQAIVFAQFPGKQPHFGTKSGGTDTSLRVFYGEKPKIYSAMMNY